MGLLDKLLNKAAPELTKLAKTAAEAVEKAAANVEKAAANAPAPQREAYIPPASQAGAGENSPWLRMPAEENQYNAGVPYREYFETIFAAEFPLYRFQRSEANRGRSTVYTFTLGGEKALVVELMTEKSDARKLRQDCLAAGTPYLRFYYDHPGWWNTRSYVVSRLKGALGA
ncbi:MAG: hypothetical protein IKP17_07630 [Oscillospiraceae bacterium]|nr:hypothetical protein [Oscillospiraceae bacterium]